MSVAENIRNIRIEAGMSQKEWAKKIGIDPSSVCLYEKGDRFPSPKTIKKIIELAKENGIDVKFSQLVKH